MRLVPILGWVEMIQHSGTNSCLADCLIQMLRVRMQLVGVLDAGDRDGIEMRIFQPDPARDQDSD